MSDTTRIFSPWRRIYRLMMFAIIAALLGPIAIMGGSAPSAGAQGWAPPNTVYMAETGHTLDRVFLDQWRDGGGAATYGYPVT
ncbi:MAG: hypothetical protein M3412_07220, partial [Chloroflexota bacterium]|nr:hypothetical protein [Chloroflexota bacterium]